MKRSLLVVSLLLSAPLLAMSYEEAQRRLETAQSRLDRAKRRVEQLSQRAMNGHQQTESIAGKAEYADDMKRRTKRFRADVNANNSAVEEHKRALTELQNTIGECAKAGHYATSEGDRYTLMKAEDKELQPIVARSAESVTAPVAARTVSRSAYRSPMGSRSYARSAYSRSSYRAM